MDYIYALLFTFIILILIRIILITDRQTRNDKILDIFIGIIVTCVGFLIATLVTTRLDEEARKSRLINYLSLTKEYYDNYFHAKNIYSSVSQMMITLKKLTHEPIENIDSIRYTYLTIPDLYERFISDESIYTLLTDEMKNDIIRFREENQIYKMQFDNIKSLDKKVSFLGQLIFKFDEQIAILEIEKEFHQEKIGREEFLSRREIIFQNKFNLNKTNQ